MLSVLSAIPVVLAGLYMVGLAIIAFAVPQKAKFFLSRFASSAFAHYLELFLRLVVGGALVLHAPRMRFPGIFDVLGWVVVVTTLVLLILPWHWHHRFAMWSVPLATKNMALFGLGSLAFGIFLLLSVNPGASFSG